MPHFHQCPAWLGDQCNCPLSATVGTEGLSPTRPSIADLANADGAPQLEPSTVRKLRYTLELDIWADDANQLRLAAERLRKVAENVETLPQIALQFLPTGTLMGAPFGEDVTDGWRCMIRVEEEAPAAMVERENFERVHRALHELWTKAVGQEGYDKPEWKTLEAAIYRLATDGPGDVLPKKS